MRDYKPYRKAPAQLLGLQPGGAICAQSWIRYSQQSRRSADRVQDLWFGSCIVQASS